MSAAPEPVAAPPAVPAEGDEVPDDEAGEHGEGPAVDTPGEESVPSAEGAHDARTEERGGECHDGRRQRGQPPPGRRPGPLGRAPVRASRPRRRCHHRARRRICLRTFPSLRPRPGSPAPAPGPWPHALRAAPEACRPRFRAPRTSAQPLRLEVHAPPTHHHPPPIRTRARPKTRAPLTRSHARPNQTHARPNQTHARPPRSHTRPTRRQVPPAQPRAPATPVVHVPRPPHRLVRRRVHPRRRPRAAAAPFPAMTPLLGQAVPGGAGGRGEGSGPRGGPGASVGVAGPGGAGGGVRVGGRGSLPASVRSLRRAWRIRCRSLETGATLSVGSIPVPLTTGGTRTPARSLRCGAPVPASRAETAGAPVHTRPRRASWGRRSTGLPECAPALRMRLVCAERAERHPRSGHPRRRARRRSTARRAPFVPVRASPRTPPERPGARPLPRPPRGTAWG
ncbi:hypothetical protein GA0115246_109861, partial [Streptomyces sp. SolWspMP-sol7th]